MNANKRKRRNILIFFQNDEKIWYVKTKGEDAQSMTWTQFISKQKLK